MAEMNLPGINPDNIEVSVEDSCLKVSSSREDSKKEKKKHYYSKEVKRGSFERIVRLPSSVQRDKILAEFKNGELTITLPKSKESNSNKIKIEVNK